MDFEGNNKNNSFAYYYLDIETVPLTTHIHDDQASFIPSKSKIITIQYQQLDIWSGKPVGELILLKEWELNSSERRIVEKFKHIYLDNGNWAFIPVGNNLLFEYRFMKYKFKQYCDLDGLYLGHRPMIDLKHILIIMNGGRFRGYAELVGKNGMGRNVANWYMNKEYDAIEDYIRQEASNFVTAYSILKTEIPKMRYEIASALLL